MFQTWYGYTRFNLYELYHISTLNRFCGNVTQLLNEFEFKLTMARAELIRALYRNDWSDYSQTSHNTHLKP